MKSAALKVFFLNVPLSLVNGRVAITQEVSALKNKKINVYPCVAENPTCRKK
jgi:hypothetical protein